MDMFATRLIRTWMTDQLYKVNSLYKFYGNKSLIDIFSDLSEEKVKTVQFSFSNESKYLLCHWIVIDHHELAARGLPTNWLYTGDVIDSDSIENFDITDVNNMFLCASPLTFAKIKQHLLEFGHVTLDHIYQYKMGISGIFCCDLEFYVTTECKLCSNEEAVRCEFSPTPICGAGHFNPNDVISGFPKL